MPRMTFGKIRHRVLALFVAIVCVLTIVVIVTTGIFTRSLVGDLVEQNARTLVQSRSYIISLWQQERIRDLRQLANSSLLETLDWELIEPFLQRRIRQSDNYHLIYFMATPDGNYHTTSMRDAGNIADRDYFPRVMAGETVISEPMISRSTDQRIVVFVTPIWSADRSSVSGVLGLSIDLVELFNGSSELTHDLGDMQVYLVDTQGRFIMHDDPNLILYGRIQDVYPGWDNLSALDAGSFTLTQDGVGYRAFFQRLADVSEWSVVVKVPTTFFSQPVNRLIWYLLAVGGVCFVLVLWLGSWFASTITDPIVELNQIFKQGAEGDLTVRAEVSSADELGETRASFNLMMNTIGTMTYYDPLTGLPNRQHFLDHLGQSLEQDATVILALVSIRDLSEIKTLLGPEITDRVLVRLAEMLRTVSDHYLVMARLADAEFGMIIPSTASGVLRTIDRLDNLLAHPLQVEVDDLNVRLFGGISISEGQNLTADTFYQQAQAALYEAEHSALEQLKLYNPNTHNAMVDRLRFQTEIRTALDRKQFTVFYQPIIDLHGRTIVGKEALIRWKHPVRGILTPGHFLTTAEQGGFIEEIGEFMLHEVCSQHKSWEKHGHDLGWVAVNISANHFRSPHFPSRVQSILHTYGTPPNLLRIEITEDAMLSPTPEVLYNFQELRKMGIRIAIDDFGTAYSTLDYLVRYPMETLKIDRTFIDDIDHDSRTAGLVRSIVGIGKNLSMAIVAEGVERSNQLDILQAMGCTEAQGYLFSRPVPWEEYPQVALELEKRLTREEL